MKRIPQKSFENTLQLRVLFFFQSRFAAGQQYVYRILSLSLGFCHYHAHCSRSFTPCRTACWSRATCLPSFHSYRNRKCRRDSHRDRGTLTTVEQPRRRQHSRRNRRPRRRKQRWRSDKHSSPRRGLCTTRLKFSCCRLHLLKRSKTLEHREHSKYPHRSSRQELFCH